MLKEFALARNGLTKSTWHYALTTTYQVNHPADGSKTRASAVSKPFIVDIRPRDTSQRERAATRSSCNIMRGFTSMILFNTASREHRNSSSICYLCTTMGLGTMFSRQRTKQTIQQTATTPVLHLYGNQRNIPVDLDEAGAPQTVYNWMRLRVSRPIT